MPVVLVIEDEKNVLENISEILEIENYKVLKAENGRSGIEAAKAYKPDIIICDIMMPELSGYDVLLQLRKDPETFYIPFIFLSAKAEKQDQRAGMNLGADDYLTKPYKNKELLEAVETRLIKEKINKSHAEKKLNKLRENLALSLPHELRTPLNGILGFSQLLKMDFREMDPDEAEIMIDNIYDSGLRLNRLIVNYLLYANLLEITSSDSWKTEEVIFNPGENVSLITRRLLDNHDRQLSLDCDSSAIQINMKNEHFNKMLEELLNNAIKFSPDNSLIKVSTLYNGSKYEIEIQNINKMKSGPDNKEVGAFIQFGRSKDEQQGSGLGLAIVKLITRLYGGDFAIATNNNSVNVSVSIPAVVAQ